MVRAAFGAARDIGLSCNASVEGMADGARDKNGSKDRPVEEAALSARLRNLGSKLGSTQLGKTIERDSGARPVADPSAMARGFRLSTELVAGVLVGAMFGWLLDRWLGISPWGLIVFLLLGFAAGVVNVMRAAGVAPGRGSGDTKRQ
jgi:ATP synthase protein I